MVIAILVVSGLGQVFVRGQQAATNGLSSVTNTSGLSSSVTLQHEPASAALRLTAPADTNSMEFVVSKTKVHLSGPAVRPLKAKGVGDFSRRVIHLFSPFSDEQPNLPAGAAVSGPVSSRAWSTIAGWSPGTSAFPDDSHHDFPQLRLISVSTERLPKEP